jgi:hypothetical protein
MDTLTSLPATRWDCATTARSAFENQAYDVRHGAVLVGYGRYDVVHVTPAGNVLFTLASGRRIALLPDATVHLSIAHDAR